MLYAHITLSDKPFMGSVTAPERALDSVKMCEIVFGKDFVKKNSNPCQVAGLKNRLFYGLHHHSNSLISEQ